MLPISIRKAGIIEKLDYAEIRRKEIDSAIYGSYESDVELPRYLGLKTEGILADVTECLDHLAKDLFEEIILPSASENINKLYFSDQKNFNTYFPFFKRNLTPGNKKLIWHELFKSHPQVYKELDDLVSAIVKQGFFSGTDIRCDILKTVRNMVNEKKHDRVFAISSLSQGRKFVQGGSGENKFSVTFDIKNHLGYDNKMRVINASSEKEVLTYRFSNNYEIGLLCGYAIYAARRVMDTFYIPFFASTDRNVSPPEEEVVITTSSGPMRLDVPIIDISGF